MQQNYIVIGSGAFISVTIGSINIKLNVERRVGAFSRPDQPRNHTGGLCFRQVAVSSSPSAEQLDV